jgi:hypothetical protein
MKENNDNLKNCNSISDWTKGLYIKLDTEVLIDYDHEIT